MVNRQIFLQFLFIALIFLTQNASSSELSISSSISDEKLSWGPCPDFFPVGCEIAVLHGDPAAPNSDIFFKIPGGYAFPAHWHTSAERMVLVSGELDVTYAGQATSSLKTGMYAYGPPKVAHNGKCISEEACVLFIAFEGPIDAHLAER